MGEPFGIVTSFSVFYACFGSEDTLYEVYDLNKTPLEGSRDVLMHEVSLSFGFDGSVLPNSLDHLHASPLCLLPSSSLGYYIDTPIDNPMIFYANVDLGYEDNVFDVLGGNVNDYVSLGYFRGYDPSIDSYCVCLEDLPRKVMWITFFNPFYDFLWTLIRLRGYLLPLV